MGVVLVLGLALPGLAVYSFTYDTTYDVKITVDVPTIQLLDMHNGDSDVTWPLINSADLDRGHSTYRGGTSFIVSSNADWEVTASESLLR